MSNNFYVIGVGELKADEIYKKCGDNLKLIKKDGGGTAWNVLCNLVANNIQTMALGVCGNDLEGDICINSLKKFNVDVDKIVRINEKTNKVFIVLPNEVVEDESVISTLTNPFTGEKLNIQYDDLWAEQIKIPNKIKGIVVIDRLKRSNEIVINRLKKFNDLKVILDIGHIGFIRYLEENKIIGFLKNISFLQMNNSVAKHLLQKLNLNAEELLKMTGMEIVILTKGSIGAEFLWRQGNFIMNKEFKIEKPAKIIDSCGAGDAFLSNFIINYIDAMTKGEIIDQYFFEKVFSTGIELTSKVVKCIGSRSHLNS